MLKLSHFPTGRPCYVDPDRVGAIFDAIVPGRAKVIGGEPELQIVGTNLMVDGTTLTIHGAFEDIAPLVIKARTPGFRTIIN